MTSLQLATGLTLAFASRAQQIGEVDTAFKLIGPDQKIVVDAYDDPEVKGVTCYVSRAKTGGIKGGLGLAEDKSEASIASDRVIDGSPQNSVTAVPVERGTPIRVR